MTINQFKSFALQSLCEEHLWKDGETQEFTLMSWRYKIEKKDGLYHLYCDGSNENEGEWARHDAFPTLGLLFNSIFTSRWISII